LTASRRRRTRAPPMELNVYKMSYEERKAKGIVSLPEGLKEAIDEIERSEFMREALGETAYQNFLSVKVKEWDAYKMQISSWEVERYLKKL